MPDESVIVIVSPAFDKFRLPVVDASTISPGIPVGIPPPNNTYMPFAGIIVFAGTV